MDPSGTLCYLRTWHIQVRAIVHDLDEDQNGSIDVEEARILVAHMTGVSSIAVAMRRGC